MLIISYNNLVAMVTMEKSLQTGEVWAKNSNGKR